jgi:hypothetical protein
MNGSDDPAFWRRRATEARRDADKFDDPSVKETLLNIANSYESVADYIEAEAKLKSERKP